MSKINVMAPPESQRQAHTGLDDQIFIRMAREDMAAFSTLYKRYVNLVYRYLLVRVGNVQDAEDLTSQTFAAAMNGLHTYRGQHRFSAWLLGIARNKAADLFRMRRPVLKLNEAMETADSSEDLDDAIDRHLAAEKVVRKLQTLSPKRAEVLSLRLFANLKVAEIAQIMEERKSNVRMLAFRGLRDLKAQFHETV